MNIDMDQQRTPLIENHLALHARVINFAGWEMPLQFSGIIEEVRAVRSATGLFDVSHMGRVEISGPSASFLPKRVLYRTYNVSALIKPGARNVLGIW